MTFVSRLSRISTSIDRRVHSLRLNNRTQPAPSLNSPHNLRGIQLLGVALHTSPHNHQPLPLTSNTLNPAMRSFRRLNIHLNTKILAMLTQDCHSPFRQIQLQALPPCHQQGATVHRILRTNKKDSERPLRLVTLANLILLAIPILNILRVHNHLQASTIQVLQACLPRPLMPHIRRPRPMSKYTTPLTLCR